MTTVECKCRDKNCGYGLKVIVAAGDENYAFLTITSRGEAHGQLSVRVNIDDLLNAIDNESTREADDD